MYDLSKVLIKIDCDMINKRARALNVKRIFNNDVMHFLYYVDNFPIRVNGLQNQVS